MTGHWEIDGPAQVDVPFQTFPDGFPAELIAAFEQRTGRGSSATSRQAARKLWTSSAKSR